MGEWSQYWKVRHKGKKYFLEENDNGTLDLDLDPALIRINGGKWTQSTSSIKALQLGETLTARTFGIIVTEVEGFNDPFDLIVTVKSSKGKEKLTYTINSTQR